MLLNQLAQLGISGKKGRFYLAALELGVNRPGTSRRSEALN